MNVTVPEPAAPFDCVKLAVNLFPVSKNDCVGVEHVEAPFVMLKVTAVVLQAAGEIVRMSSSVAPAVEHRELKPELLFVRAPVIATESPADTFVIVAWAGFAGGKRLSPQTMTFVVGAPAGPPEGDGPSTTFGCCVPMKDTVVPGHDEPVFVIVIVSVTLLHPAAAVGVTARVSV